MKNARAYEKKTRKLLAGMGKGPQPAPCTDTARVALLIRSVLEEDATREQADQAFQAIENEYVDFNDLRVSPPKEIIDHVGKEFPGARAKAEALSRALNAIFDKTSTMTMDYMDKMPKRDLRRHLLEIGLSPYAAATVVLQAFGGHAVAVSATLAECMAMEGYVHPDSSVEDVQGFLERIIPHKDAMAAHDFFREYVRKCHKALMERRQAQRKKAQEQAALEAARQKLAEEEAAKAAKAAEQAEAPKAEKPARPRQPAAAVRPAARPKQPREPSKPAKAPKARPAAAGKAARRQPRKRPK